MHSKLKLSALYQHDSPKILGKVNKLPGMDELLAKFGGEMVEVVFDHFADFVNRREIYANTSYFASLREYFSYPASLINGEWIVSGRQISSWLSLLMASHFGQIIPTRGWSVAKGFIGRKGCSAHMHFDEDFAPSIHVLISGRKHFHFFSADLTPDICYVFNWGKYRTGELVVKRTSIKTDGFHFFVSLDEGEALFIPPCLWHSVEYDKDSIGISLRMHASPFLTFLANRLHSSPLKLMLAAKSWRGELGSEYESTLWLELVQAYSCTRSRHAAHANVQHILESSLHCSNEILQKLSSGACGALGREALRKALASGIWYSDA